VVLGLLATWALLLQLSPMGEAAVVEANQVFITAKVVLVVAVSGLGRSLSGVTGLPTREAVVAAALARLAVQQAMGLTVLS